MSARKNPQRKSARKKYRLKKVWKGSLRWTGWKEHLKTNSRKTVLQKTVGKNQIERTQVTKLSNKRQRERLFERAPAKDSTENTLQRNARKKPRRNTARKKAVATEIFGKAPARNGPCDRAHGKNPNKSPPGNSQFEADLAKRPAKRPL